jgi:cytochrome c553
MKTLLASLLGLSLAFPLAASAADSTKNSAKNELQRVTRAAPDPERGATLFAQCASCHGDDGNGTPDGAFPRIAGQHYSVLLRQIVDFRHGKRWDFRMEEFADRHHLPTSQDIADVAVYVASLERGGKRGVGDGSHASDGALIFGARCASCHRFDGSGDAARSVPRLGGQHYSYLIRQMYDAVDGRRPSLEAVHAQKIEPLDFQQVRAVADYLSRVGWTLETD